MQNDYIIWKPVKGFEGLYEVSNDGQVKSLDRISVRPSGTPVHVTGRIKKTSIGNKGYPMVCLTKDRKSHTCTVHRLMAIAFLEPKKGMDQINHIDGVKTNNHLSNLEWSNNSLNQKHRHDALGHSGSMKGRFNDGSSKAIIAMASFGNIIHDFPSAREAERHGFKHKQISKVLRGDRKRHAGLLWKYKGGGSIIPLKSPPKK